MYYIKASLASFMVRLSFDNFLEIQFYNYD